MWGGSVSSPGSALSWGQAVGLGPLNRRHPGITAQGCPILRFVPQSDGVADMTRRGDELSLTPKKCSADRHARRPPRVLREHKEDRRRGKNSGVPCTEKAASKKEVNAAVQKGGVRHGAGGTVSTTGGQRTRLRHLTASASPETAAGASPTTVGRSALCVQGRQAESNT